MKTMLAEGLRQLNLVLSDEQQNALLGYVLLLDKWNKVYNLTSVRDPKAMLVQHILDSVAMVHPIVKHVAAVEGRGALRLLDVGSGPGLPAVPLAICCPEWEVVSLDGHHKRTAFVQQVAIELCISNVEAVQQRVESWKASALFDVVISRAFAELSDFVGLSHQHVAQGGVLIAMKGIYPFEELERLGGDWKVREVEHLTVPFLDAQRHAVVLERQ